MIIDILLLIAGLILILGGANYLTEGASAVAKKWGVSELVIGLTIVAFGTSAPELVISLMSAVRHSAGLAIGNVVGSNIFNILVIIGVVAMVRPIKVERSILSTEIPLVILSSLAILICGNSHIINGSGDNVLSRTDGLLLLLFFAVFMRYTFSIAKDGSENTQQESQVKSRPLWLSTIMILGGLGALVGGGEIFVNGATGVAKALNVSEAVIGVTIVAAGTSLPELATSIVAAMKNSPGLAVGNVVGSCLFNVFFVLGASATVSPLPLDGITNLDLLTLTGASVLFWLFGSYIRRRTFTRAEGALMFACYVAYTIALIAKA